MSFPTNADFAAAASAAGLVDETTWTPREGGLPSGAPSTVVGKFVSPYTPVLGVQSESPSFYGPATGLVDVKVGDLLIVGDVHYNVRVVNKNTPVQGDTLLQLSED